MQIWSEKMSEILQSIKLTLLNSLQEHNINGCDNLDLLQEIITAIKLIDTVAGELDA